MGEGHALCLPAFQKCRGEGSSKSLGVGPIGEGAGIEFRGLRVAGQRVGDTGRVRSGDEPAHADPAVFVGGGSDQVAYGRGPGGGGDLWVERERCVGGCAARRHRHVLTEYHPARVVEAGHDGFDLGVG